MKRLITFALVLVMLASMLALPAMATEVEARYAVVYCNNCAGEMKYMGQNNALDAYQYYCSACDFWYYIYK